MASLDRLRSAYSGFMEGKVVDSFLREFNVKFAAGTWTAGDFSDTIGVATSQTYLVG